MAVKGSKYARKHLKEIQEKTKPDIEDTFLDVVYDDRQSNQGLQNFKGSFGNGAQNARRKSFSSGIPA